MTTKLEEEVRKTFASKYSNYFESRVQIDLAGKMYKKAPHCIIDAIGEDSYMDYTNVYIGLAGFPSTTEDELFIDTCFAVGHETGHFHFSREDALRFGMQEGFRRICMYGAKKEGWKGVFQKDSDYENFQKWLESNNIIINISAIKQTIHHVINSVEDGRMENLYEMFYPGWGPYRVSYRGRVWLETKVEAPLDYKDPRENLNAVLNEIWGLACFNIPLIDFDKYYGPTTLAAKKVAEVEDLIWSAVNTKTSRGAATIYLQIIDKIADLIWEASKLNDMEKMLQKLIQQYGKNGHGDGDGDPGDNGKGCSGSDEAESLKGLGFDKNGNPIKGDKDGDENEDDSSNSKNDGASANKILFTPSGNAGARNVGCMAGSLSEEAIEKMKKDIEQAMEDAAQAMAGDIGFAKTIVNSTGNSTAQVRNDQVDGAKEIHDAFCDEYFRKYDVSSRMPIEWEAPAKQFKRKIDALFETKLAYTTRCQTSGRIDQAFKFAIKQIDGFSRSRKESPVDIAVAIAQDNSGSMGYGESSKRWFAGKATAMIEEAFSSKFPLKIVAFDAGGANVANHEVIKNWNDKFTNSCSYNFTMKGRGGGCNNDAATITQMTKELLNRPEAAKMLIVLSDGCPSACRNEDVTKAVMYARSKGIAVVGIYFADDYEDNYEALEYVKMYGGIDAITTTPECISNELVRVLKNFVARNL